MIDYNEVRVNLPKINRNILNSTPIKDLGLYGTLVERSEIENFLPSKFMKFAMDERSLPLIKLALDQIRSSKPEYNAGEILRYMYVTNTRYQGDASLYREDKKFFSDVIKLVLAYDSNINKGTWESLDSVVESFLTEELRYENKLNLFRGDSFVNKKLEYTSAAEDLLTDHNAFLHLRQVEKLGYPHEEYRHLHKSSLHSFRDTLTNTQILNEDLRLPHEVINNVYKFLKPQGLNMDTKVIGKLLTAPKHTEYLNSPNYLQLKQDLTSVEEAYRLTYKPQPDSLSQAFLVKDIIENWSIYNSLYNLTFAPTIKKFAPESVTNLKLPEFLKSDYLWAGAHFASSFIYTLGSPVGAVGQFAIPLMSTALYYSSLKVQEILKPNYLDSGVELFTKSALSIAISTLSQYNNFGLTQAIASGVNNSIFYAISYLNSREELDKPVEKDNSLPAKLIDYGAITLIGASFYSYIKNLGQDNYARKYALNLMLNAIKFLTAKRNVEELVHKLRDPNSLTSQTLEEIINMVKYYAYKVGLSSYDLDSLSQAARTGDLKLIKSLIDQGAKGQDKVLTEAIIRGEYEVIELLLDEGTEPDSYSIEELLQPYNLDVTKFVVDKISSKAPDTKLGALKGQIGEGIKELLVVASTKKDKKLIQDIAEHGKGSLLKELGDTLQKFAGAQFKNKLLKAAAYTGNSELVKWLIENGANAKSEALDNAFLGKHFGLAKLLIAQGTPITDSTIDIIKDTDEFGLFIEEHQGIINTLGKDGLNIYIGLFLSSVSYGESTELARLLVENNAELIANAIGSYKTEEKMRAAAVYQNEAEAVSNKYLGLPHPENKADSLPPYELVDEVSLDYCPAIHGDEAFCANAYL